MSPTLPSIDQAPAPIDQALLPANVRRGGTTARNAYEEGLAFEQVLVSQLAQQLANGLDATAAALGTDPASTDASATSAYTQMLPSALTSSIMSGGGLGVAAQLAAAIDPAIKGNSPGGSFPSGSAGADPGEAAK